MATDPVETLRLVYAHLTDELDDVRQESARLSLNLQSLPAVGAVSLALFAALATLPPYQKPAAAILLVLGLAPFIILTVISIRELDRKPESSEPLLLTEDEDRLAPIDWLAIHIGERRTEIRALREAIVLKRTRLAWCSAWLAIQIGYLVVVTTAVAFVAVPT